MQLQRRFSMNMARAAASRAGAAAGIVAARYLLEEDGDLAQLARQMGKLPLLRRATRLPECLVEAGAASGSDRPCQAVSMSG